MKTLKSLLADFLQTRKLKEEPPTNQNTTNQNSDNHETESDENPGIPGMDNSDAGESDGNAQEAIPEPGDAGTRRDFEAELKEAYQKGVIDGRNAKIEEQYFPKHDDGIPQFRGAASASNSAPNIFSMAREA